MYFVFVRTGVVRKFTFKSRPSGLWRCLVKMEAARSSEALLWLPQHYT